MNVSPMPSPGLRRIRVGGLASQLDITCERRMFLKHKILEIQKSFPCPHVTSWMNKVVSNSCTQDNDAIYTY